VHHYARPDPRKRRYDNVAFLPTIDNHSHAIRLVEPDCVYCKPLLADDWPYPECLEKMVRCALDPAIGLVCSVAATEKNEVLFNDLASMRSRTTGSRDVTRVAFLCSSTATSSVRRSPC
jgi:hypothetical protein